MWSSSKTSFLRSWGGGMMHCEGVLHYESRTDKTESGWKMSLKGDVVFWRTVYAVSRASDSKTGHWGPLRNSEHE